MYAVIVNSPYDANTIITASPSDTKNALATWVLVFYGTNYTLGDVVNIQYANQIKFGVDKFSFTAPRGVIEEKLTSYKIYNNYPNPFNPATKIRFFLPEAGFVKVEVFDILGQRVAVLTNKEFQSGIHELDFNGSVFVSGIYIYTLEVKDRFFEAKKMLLLK
jgi:Secretion system C-terminal sorting domain